ncbi:MAG: hypothetical protein JSR86_20155 [Proteobacteria bacterium]|nr:hypothetical protein [Pseudomonadota bacterium]
MLTAGQRCGLFTPPLMAALASAQAQARGAALRAGTAPASLDATGGRARAKAMAVACGSPDLSMAAARVRAGFQGYGALRSMDFPGDMAAWRADRTAPRGPDQTVWRLVQSTRAGWDSVDFGLTAGRGGPGLAAVAAFADGAQPYAARLVMRDPAQAAAPFLDPRTADARGRIPLSGRLPPRWATQAFAASGRAPAGREMLPAGAKSAWMLRFPPAAEAALAGLDPREAVAVEFLFPGRAGDQVRTAYVEVGDFAAGRAFLAAGPH